MAPDVERDILERVRMDRRGFVRKVIAGTAFATPLLASFDMRSTTAYADCFSPNQTVDLEDEKFRIELVSCKEVDQDVLRIRVRVRNADNGKNRSSSDLKVKLIDIEPDPPSTDQTQGWDFRNTDHPYYQLKLNVSDWKPGSYQLDIRVGDNHLFNFSIDAHLN